MSSWQDGGPLAPMEDQAVAVAAAAANMGHSFDTTLAPEQDMELDPQEHAEGSVAVRVRRAPSQPT